MLQFNNMNITTAINQLLPKIKTIRHTLHAHPELGFAEKKTMQIIAKALREFNLSVQEGIGETGLVAVVDSGKPGQTIGLRADIDALAINETTQLSYTSKHHGQMHACGHDGHTAIMLCVAGVLATIREQFTGKVVFIFQPAEELGSGAKAMLDDDLLSQYPLDLAYTLHNFPLFPAGHFAVKKGCILAAMDAFRIEISGVAGHASIPEKCINPIEIAATLQMQLQNTLAAEFKHDPMTSINMTQINSPPSASINVTPGTVTLQGITRAGSDTSLTQLRQTIKTQLKQIATHYEAKIDIAFTHTCPATINTEEPTQQLIDAVNQTLGNDKLKILESSLATFDDFSYFLQQLPGCYFLIGNGETNHMVHTSNYDFNDDIILPAARVLIQLIKQSQLNHF